MTRQKQTLAHRQKKRTLRESPMSQERMFRGSAERAAGSLSAVVARRQTLDPEFVWKG